MDWESDEEFEASLLEIDDPTPASSLSKVEVKFKPPAVSSTPINGEPTVMFDTESTIKLNSSSRSALSNLDKNLPGMRSPTQLMGAPHGKKRRKFPGPAGTLPKLNRNIDLKSLKDVPAPTESDPINPEPVLSQSSQPLSVECNLSWKKLTNDLEISHDHLKKHSIQNALVNAAKQKLPDGKAPLLVVAIESINKTFPDATVMLKDLTGSMQGVIHRLLVKQYNCELKVGSVLLLKQVAVFSPAPRRKYLNITQNNLLQIYSEDEKTAKVLRKTVSDLKTPLHSLLSAPIALSDSAPAQASLDRRSVPSPDLFTSAVRAGAPKPIHHQTSHIMKTLSKNATDAVGTNLATHRLTNQTSSIEVADHLEFSGDDDDFEDLDLYDI